MVLKQTPFWQESKKQFLSSWQQRLFLTRFGYSYEKCRRLVSWVALAIPALLRAGIRKKFSRILTPSRNSVSECLRSCNFADNSARDEVAPLNFEIFDAIRNEDPIEI
ncbi:uncharacterized protein LOC134199343 [Bombyx mori]|uniref:uncharacterized protein LOC134199343 n=1 Tax=Bombyx mori TaxID=7091 RepID=UPI002ED2C7E2